MTQGYRKPRDPAERFWEKVDRSGECWLWTASTGGPVGRKYGDFPIGSRTDGTRRLVKAHRFAYELAHGPIPNGLFLHHLCENPLCVRPSHLEPVTPKEHIYRHDGPTAQNGRLTHCRKCGRELAGANLITEVGGGRRCRACRRESVNAADRRRRRLKPMGAFQAQIIERDVILMGYSAQGYRGCELARMTGLSETTISTITNGKRAWSKHLARKKGGARA